jgi:hypothetical protein
MGLVEKLWHGVYPDEVCQSPRPLGSDATHSALFVTATFLFALDGITIWMLLRWSGNGFGTRDWPRLQRNSFTSTG